MASSSKTLLEDVDETLDIAALHPDQHNQVYSKGKGKKRKPSDGGDDGAKVKQKKRATWRAQPREALDQLLSSFFENEELERLRASRIVTMPHSNGSPVWWHPAKKLSDDVKVPAKMRRALLEVQQELARLQIMRLQEQLQSGHADAIEARFREDCLMWLDAGSWKCVWAPILPKSISRKVASELQRPQAILDWADQGLSEKEEKAVSARHLRSPQSPPS